MCSYITMKEGRQSRPAVRRGPLPDTFNDHPQVVHGSQPKLQLYSLRNLSSLFIYTLFWKCVLLFEILHFVTELRLYQSSLYYSCYFGVNLKLFQKNILNELIYNL